MDRWWCGVRVLSRCPVSIAGRTAPEVTMGEEAGITAATLFERFWREDERDRRGAGLGLSISKGIVRAHGGDIWAESQRGVGTTFFFTLPSA